MEIWSCICHIRKIFRDLLWMCLVLFPVIGMTQNNHIQFKENGSPIQISINKKGLPIFHFADGREAEVRLQMIKPYEFYLKADIIESTCASKKIDRNQLQCQILIPTPNLKFSLVWTKNPINSKKIGVIVKSKEGEYDVFF